MTQSRNYMSKKLGRNDPCWCGSGKKYKKCHLGRNKMQAPNPVQAAVELEKTLRNKKYCLHPEASIDTCKGGIVKAHTIQRNGGLSRIAHDGHVFRFWRDHIKRTFVPTLVGIKEASTFTGFCNFHDSKIFEPIEKNPFQSNQQHAFLLAYRALCMGLYISRVHYEAIPHFRNLDRGKNIVDQFYIQKRVRAIERSVGASLRDTERYKLIYDKALTSGDFSEVKYYILRLQEAPEILCSGAIFPELDFQGNLLQDLEKFETFSDLVTFSIIATDDGGAAVFAWLGDNHTSCEMLVKSLAQLSGEQIPHAVVRFVFAYFDNFYFSPKWWDNLGDNDRSRIKDRFISALDTGLDGLRKRRNCISDNDLQVVSWNVISKDTNLLI